MKLTEISDVDDPIVVALVQKRLDSGDTVTISWTEHGRDHKADVDGIRRGLSGSGYAILCSYYDNDLVDKKVSDKIFFSTAALENAKLSKTDTAWHLDLRKT